MRPFYVVCVMVEWIFALAALGGGIWLVHAGHTGMAIPAFFFFSFVGGVWRVSIARLFTHKIKDFYKME